MSGSGGVDDLLANDHNAYSADGEGSKKRKRNLPNTNEDSITNHMPAPECTGASVTLRDSVVSVVGSSRTPAAQEKRFV